MPLRQSIIAKEYLYIIPFYLCYFMDLVYFHLFTNLKQSLFRDDKVFRVNILIDSCLTKRLYITDFFGHNFFIGSCCCNLMDKSAGPNIEKITIYKLRFLL